MEQEGGRNWVEVWNWLVVGSGGPDGGLVVMEQVEKEIVSGQVELTVAREVVIMGIITLIWLFLELAL